jgi:hypothetical protein
MHCSSSVHHSAPLGRCCQKSGNDYHLVVGHRRRPPRRYGRRSERAHINVKNVDGGPPGRQCQRSGSTHHQRKKCRRWAHWEAMPEIREYPPSTQKMSTVGPLGGSAGGSGAATIKIKNIDGGPPGRWCQRFRSAHYQRKKC